VGLFGFFLVLPLLKIDFVLPRYFIIASATERINKITQVLEDYPMLKSIGTSSDYDEVMNTTLKEKPVLVFLDIDNFTDTPFNFVQKLQQYIKNTPHLIAISATKDSAYDEIKFHRLFISSFIRIRH